MKEYRKRIVDNILLDKLEEKGAVVIEGPKWCGKTTTGLQVSKSVLRMDDPSEFENNLYASSINPTLLLQGKNPRLIDEWQLAPKLWDAIRYEVDIRGEEGQFILTGSAVPADTKQITHSGTGRFTWLLMRTMSLFESGESSGEISLSSLFDAPDYISGTNPIDINKLAYLICRGGWPHAIDMKEKPSLAQAKDYYSGVIKSDISRVDNISKNPERTKKIMQSLARNQGTQIPYTKIRDDIIANDSETLHIDTVIRYIDALKKIFVVEDMPAWNPNIRSKAAIRTADTRYFVDPSIATAALGASPEDLLLDLHTMGLMFETLCVRDIRIYSQAIEGDVYHYRDKSGLECDMVVHLQNGKYGLIEVKLGGEEAIEKAIQSLKALANKIDTKKMRSPSFSMVIVGVGKYAYKKEGVYIVPIGCLRE